jgi:hypothetical protein
MNDVVWWARRDDDIACQCEKASTVNLILNCFRRILRELISHLIYDVYEQLQSMKIVF